TSHLHSGQVHQTLQSVLPFAGRLYAAGTTDGISASDDGGQTWTQLGAGVAGVGPGQVVAFHGALWAATSNGVYRYLLTSAAPAPFGPAPSAPAPVAPAPAPIVPALVAPPPVAPPPPTQEDDRTRRLPRLSDLPDTRVLRQRQSRAGRL